MRAFLALAAGGLLLAGCSTATNERIDAKIKENLPAACQYTADLHYGFVLASMTGHVSDDVIAYEADAWAIAEDLCADPENATRSDVIRAVVAAAFTISEALREVRN